MDHRRIHGIEKAGAGDLGAIDDDGDALGPCPSCGAPLRVVQAKHPHTGQRERALAHPAPFCTYYGETHPSKIERDVREARRGD